MKLSYLALSLGLASYGVVAAGAHQHGVAELNLAMEGTDLLVELHSPAANILGFEHAPVTAEQKQTLKEASHALESALLILPASCQLLASEQNWGALQASEHAHDDDHEHEHEAEHAHDDDHEYEHEAEHAHDDDHEHEHEAEHAHDDDHEHEHEAEHAHDDEHEHEAEHAHDDDHEHEHEGEHDHDHEAEHADIAISYHYQCDNLAALKQLEFSPLFEAFPAIEKLNVQAITVQGQTHQLLNSHQSTLSW